MHADQILRNLMYIVVGILVLGLVITTGTEKLSALSINIPFL